MESLFEKFMEEKRFLTGVSAKTISIYNQSFKTYQRVLSDGESSKLPTKDALKDFVTGMRQRGMKPTSCNSYIRGMNSFLTWLFENGHTTEHLRIKQLKVEKRVLKTFTDAQVRAIFQYKPKTFCEHRLHTLLCVLADTGIRINEALTLKRSKIDFNNLLLTVTGKGKKERVVPFSFECRKVLYKYLTKHQFDLVFCTRHGGRILYDNTRRDFSKLMERLHITGFDGAFHAFRRCFAKGYLRRGGNVIYLREVLGHSSVTTTEKYVEVETAALQEIHGRVSILENIH